MQGLTLGVQDYDLSLRATQGSACPPPPAVCFSKRYIALCIHVVFSAL